MIEQAVFILLSAITLTAAVLVVWSRTVFVGALWLVLSFVGVAGLYVMAGAYFLGVVQVLVYVGAISVLILFAVMLTRDVMGEDTPFNRESALAAFAVSGVALFLAVIGYGTDWSLTEGALPPPEGVAVPDPSVVGAHAALIVPAAGPDAAATLPGTVAMLGRSLMTEHLLAFEVISVVLLVALVGAIVIARD